MPIKKSPEEIIALLDKEMFENIKKDIDERMSVITDSRQPTGDDIRITWLVDKLEELNYPPPELPTTQSQTFKKIESNLKERMSGYTDSRQPTDDDVRIAWLFAEVCGLNEKVNKQNEQQPLRLFWFSGFLSRLGGASLARRPLRSTECLV